MGVSVPSSAAGGSVPEQEDLGLYAAAAVIDVRGVLPASIGQLRHLVALSIVSTGLTGEVPPSLGSIKGLEMIWLDTNSSSGTYSA